MRPVVFAFIDSQNLNLGVQNDVKDRKGYLHKGWKLDFVKFRRYLSDKYRVEVAFLFIGNKPGNEPLYEYLRQAGYELVIKQTTTFQDDTGRAVTKGNVDTDLVIYAAAREYSHYTKAVVVSGDGDFLSLYDFLAENDKLLKIIIPNKLRYSKLLNHYAEQLDFLTANRQKVELRIK